MLLVVILITFFFSLKGFNDLKFFDKYKFNVKSIVNGDKYRMFSSAFLHVDFNHLFFNLFTLFVFSSSIINKLGDFYYLSIYILSLYFGNYYTLQAFIGSYSIAWGLALSESGNDDALQAWARAQVGTTMFFALAR